jgi:hypothetical protein
MNSSSIDVGALHSDGVARSERWAWTEPYGNLVDQRQNCRPRVGFWAVFVRRRRLRCRGTRRTGTTWDGEIRSLHAPGQSAKKVDEDIRIEQPAVR